MISSPSLVSICFPRQHRPPLLQGLKLGRLGVRGRVVQRPGPRAQFVRSGVPLFEQLTLGGDDLFLASHDELVDFGCDGIRVSGVDDVEHLLVPFH